MLVLAMNEGVADQAAPLDQDVAPFTTDPFATDPFTTRLVVKGSVIIIIIIIVIIVFGICLVFLGGG